MYKRAFEYMYNVFKESTSNMMTNKYVMSHTLYGCMTMSRRVLRWACFLRLNIHVARIKIDLIVKLSMLFLLKKGLINKRA